ncbi:hypothetical protein Taro_003488 [Colocasia esculenta]|uniref:Pentatricopeptide repeat-containing protein n=1 Tax=Colocasia esculenta TaxID=4460 RepID=A0A843TNW7_COLES|nr:hypothetical protein [Colocasia esculenta]
MAARRIPPPHPSSLLDFPRPHLHRSLPTTQLQACNKPRRTPPFPYPHSIRACPSLPSPLHSGHNSRIVGSGTHYEPGQSPGPPNFPPSHRKTRAPRPRRRFVDAPVLSCFAAVSIGRREVPPSWPAEAPPSAPANKLDSPLEPLVGGRERISQRRFVEQIVRMRCRCCSKDAHLLGQPDRLLPDSSLFADLLQSCIASGSLHGVRQTHARLLKSQFSTETFVLNRLIDAYAKCGSLDIGKILFDRMPQRNVFSWNSMISAYTKLDCLEEAAELFGTMPVRDQCSWNSMISGFTQHGLLEDALRYFNEMHAEDFILNVYSFSSALSACAGLKDSKMGMQIHALISKCPLAFDVFMGSALVDMYSKCGRPSHARRVFDMMPVRNVVSWNSLITCYEQNGPVIEALLLFSRMVECKVEPDEVTFASVVSACATLLALREGLQIHARTIKCDKFRNDLVLGNALVDMYAKCSRINEARIVFDRMSVRNVISETSMLSGYAKYASVEAARSMFTRMTERNIVAWNALIAGYTQTEENEEALRLFRQLKREAFWPTHYTLGNIVNACANLASLQLGQQAHAHVLKHGFKFEPGPVSDVFVGNSLVDLYLKCGATVEAKRVFETMVGRDRVSWNAMIVGHAQNGCGEEALGLFKRMLVSGEKPDHVTMIGVLSACSHAGLVEEGRKYFLSMTEEYACRIHRNVDLGEVAAQSLFELDPENSAPYVLLSNMYAEMGRWEDAVRVRKQMRQKGVAKQPGCSWIGIEKKVHVFMARDRRHPRRKEVYTTLETLKLQMKRAGCQDEVDVSEDLVFSCACG